MKALISPLENNRICQIEPDADTFPIAEPLFWTTCPDDCTTEWTYVEGQFIAPVIPEPIVILQPTKEELLAKLLEIQTQLQGLV